MVYEATVVMTVKVRVIADDEEQAGVIAARDVDLTDDESNTVVDVRTVAVEEI